MNLIEAQNLIPKIAPQTVRVYFNSEFVGLVNQYEFNALRIKIKEQKISGFSVQVEEGGERAMIQNNGLLNNWPIGLFDLFSEQLDKLLD